MKEYFIMAYNQKGTSASPMIDAESDSVVFFESLKEARETVKNHPYCQAFGYQIFKLGAGEQ